MSPRSVLTSHMAGVVLAALLLAGCAINDQIDHQVDRLERSVDAARNEAILKNVVRASEDQPLNFVTVPTLHGSNSLASSLGLPAIAIGPDKYFTAAEHLAVFGGGMGGSGAANTVTATGTTSFDVTALESKEFYRGLLNPVAPSTIALFAAQDVPREVLFYLFVDRLTIQNSTGLHIYHNDPSDPSFPAFQKYVELAVDYGLSFEAVSSPGGARRGPMHRDTPANAGNSARSRTGDTATSDNGSAPDADVRLCFDPELARLPLHNVHPICGTSEAAGPRRGGVYMSSAGPAEVSTKPRSIFELFQYLGRLVALGDAGRIHLQSDEAKRWSATPDDVLFQVTRGGVNCFVAVSGTSGNYCLPAEGASNSIRILGVLTQLVALSTSIADVPFTPTVHIAN